MENVLPIIFGGHWPGDKSFPALSLSKFPHAGVIPVLGWGREGEISYPSVGSILKIFKYKRD